MSQKRTILTIMKPTCLATRYRMQVERLAPPSPRNPGYIGTYTPHPHYRVTPLRPPGDYRVRTLIGTEAQRTLGARSIQSIDDRQRPRRTCIALPWNDSMPSSQTQRQAACRCRRVQSAVDQASVYRATLVGEAVRIPGAAHIWFSHNHPSGTASLSSADRALYAALADTFDGSGIQPMGLIAVAGSRYALNGRQQQANSALV